MIFWRFHMWSHLTDFGCDVQSHWILSNLCILFNKIFELNCSCLFWTTRPFLIMNLSLFLHGSIRKLYRKPNRDIYYLLHQHIAHVKRRKFWTHLYVGNLHSEHPFRRYWLFWFSVKMSDENEWELSKENVQPIRQGRHLSNLSAGLQLSEDQIAQLRKEKQLSLHLF